jgi:hypothetical protein
MLQLGSRRRWDLRHGATSPWDRLHRYWNDLSAKAMSERFGNLQTFLAPAAKLRSGEALRLPSVLDVAAAPTQWVHGIRAVSEAAVGATTWTTNRNSPRLPPAAPSFIRAELATELLLKRSDKIAGPSRSRLQECLQRCRERAEIREQDVETQRRQQSESTE